MEIVWDETKSAADIITWVESNGGTARQSTDLESGDPVDSIIIDNNEPNYAAHAAPGCLISKEDGVFVSVALDEEVE